jgi:hypothetical protein
MTEQMRIDYTHPSSPLDRGEITYEEEMVWEAIRPHRGKGYPILGPRISEITKIDYDRVRQTIAHLINSHGYLIASNSKGYYVPQTSEEIFEATKSLRHRALSILWRASRLQKTSLVEVFNQSLLEFKNNVDSP